MPQIIKVSPGKKRPGSVTTFLRHYRQGMVRGEMSVPCDGCTGCCRSAKLHVDLDQHELSSFPEAVQHPDGFWALPENPDGSCVHLVDDKCSIYERRPRACRTFDCRWHTLMGTAPDNDPPFFEAIAQWDHFAIPTTDDVDTQTAVRIAVADGGVPDNYRDATRKAAGFARYLPKARALRQLLATMPRDQLDQFLGNAFDE